MSYSIKRILFLADSNGAGLFNAITGAYGGVPMANTNWDMTLDLMWGAPSAYGVDRSRYHIDQVRKGKEGPYALVVTDYCAGDAIGEFAEATYDGTRVSRADTLPCLINIHALWKDAGTPILIALPAAVSPTVPPSLRVEAELVQEFYGEVFSGVKTLVKKCPIIRLTLPQGNRARFFMPPETGDWIHMSPAGYTYMAQRLVKKMRGLVK